MSKLSLRPTEAQTQMMPFTSQSIATRVKVWSDTPVWEVWTFFQCLLHDDWRVDNSHTRVLSQNTKTTLMGKSQRTRSLKTYYKVTVKVAVTVMCFF